MNKEPKKKYISDKEELINAYNQKKLKEVVKLLYDLMKGDFIEKDESEMWYELEGTNIDIKYIKEQE